MEITETIWPEAKDALPDDLRDDPYIQCSAKHYVQPPNVLRICNGNIMGVSDRPYGLEVWFEAHNDHARDLLQGLPTDRDLCISIGTATGLEFIQDELEGRVKPLSLFCVVDKRRFCSQEIHNARLLTAEDRHALEDYATSHNAKMFLQFSSEGKVNLYGVYHGKTIVGCCGVFCGDNQFSWIEVKPEFRGQGYGRSLISVCVRDMLLEHEMVSYEACMDEMANLRVCLAVGFVPLRETFYFEGKRRSG